MDLLFGRDNKREIAEYERIISRILKYRKELVTLSNDELKNKTTTFKERLKKGESLDDVLPEAFAVAKEASRRFLGKEQRDVQLMGAIALHRGDIAEMKTGEGKTLTAPIAAYLNALTGKSVHIATSNDYLSQRDCEEIRPMFEGLGLTVGVVTEERKSNDLEKRKEAYSCDITYGSSNAFAFDYLMDNTAKTREQIVRGEKEVGFIVIDEVDQILVNDAVMPFRLSGNKIQNNSKGKTIEELLKEEEKRAYDKEIIANNSNASVFVSMLFNRYKEEVKLYKNVKNDAIKRFGKGTLEYKEFEKVLKREYPLSCGAFVNPDDMKRHQGLDKKLTENSQSKYSVLFCKGDSATLTEKGWLEAFSYFKGTDIKKYINNNKELVTNNNFELNEDYIMDENEITLTTKGLEKAVKNIPAIREMNNSFYGDSKFNGLSIALDNALKAYFVLEKGKDYILQDSIDLSGKVKKKVLLVSNGRTAEGRVYSGGLQQAIELKEAKLDDSITVEKTTELDELASVSQKAFYSIYPKISGMTGTSAKELFESVYGMDTISIPKHSEYNVGYEEIDKIYSGREDKDTVLFATEQDKLDAVISSALESQRKGQPVLIGTLSVNESNKLYKAFASRGIECSVLNAENLEEEAKIISRAGMKGAITISTQMAGRGTDIKLGGELEDAIELEKQSLANSMVELLDKNIPLEKRRELAIQYIERKKMDIVTSSAINNLEKSRQELIESGGLKVIGYGHYPTKRDDDQLRGRAARQADPGTTEFYVCIDDLKKNLGISNEAIIETLSKELAVSKAWLRRDLSTHNELSYFQKEGISSVGVSGLIAGAQKEREGILTNIISSTQEVDHNLSRMRRKVYEQRTRMMNGEDTKDNMLYIIDSSIVNLINRNIPEHVYTNHKNKIKNSGINLNNFIIDVEETFGIDLTKGIEDNKFRTLGDIERFLQKEMHKQYLLTREKNGDEKQNEIDRINITNILDGAWRDFNDNLEYIKFQNSLHSLVQNKDYNEIYAMKTGFNNCMASAKIQMLGKMFGKISTKTREDKEEKLEIEVEEDINDYSVYDKKSYNNLNVRPAKIISVFGEKLKVIKDRIKYQFELVPIDKVDEHDSVQKINFDNNDVQQDNMSKKK